MSEVLAFFSRTLGARLATLICSAIPLIELKGSILYARSATAGLGFFEAYGLSYAGSTAVFFLLFFLLVPVLNLLKKIKPFRRLAEGVENYISERAKREMEKRGAGDPVKTKRLAVFLFVAIPIPMTGVWMGTALAVFLGLRFRDAILPVALGNLIAGGIISVLAELFLPYVDVILYALLALALILFIVMLIKVLKKGKETHTDGTL